MISDLVGARRTPDRAALQDALAGALAAVNAHLDSAVQPLEATVGDEFQGVYATVQEAALAGTAWGSARPPSWTHTRC